MLGILLGSLVFTLMEWLCTPAFIQLWGWRLAFLGGFGILLIAGWLRWTMPVSPHFEKAKSNGTLVAHPVRNCLRNHFGTLMRGILLISLPSMLCYAYRVHERLSTQAGRSLTFCGRSDRDRRHRDGRGCSGGHRCMVGSSRSKADHPIQFHRFDRLVRSLSSRWRSWVHPHWHGLVSWLER